MEKEAVKVITFNLLRLYWSQSCMDRFRICSRLINILTETISDFRWIIIVIQIKFKVIGFRDYQLYPILFWQSRSSDYSRFTLWFQLFKNSYRETLVKSSLLISFAWGIMMMHAKRNERWNSTVEKKRKKNARRRNRRKEKLQENIPHSGNCVLIGLKAKWTTSKAFRSPEMMKWSGSCVEWTKLKNIRSQRNRSTP